MGELEDLRERLMRPALLFSPGSSLEASDSPKSLFGSVTHMGLEESWPQHQGTFLCPLLQLRLDDLPFKPDSLREFAFLTLFVHPEAYPEGEANGTTWSLRTYGSLNALKPVQAPDLDWPIRALPLDKPVLIEDYPCFEDLEQDLEEELWDEFQQRFPTRDGIKLGGWPRLLQSEIYWAPFNKHPAQPKYSFQVDSLPEAGWQWGDQGCAYFGRGTAPGRKKDWAVEWQCF